jgi:DNA-binding NarL/FixJ family response regulator
LISTPVVCPRFVGRESELAYLVERRRALAKVHGGIVLVGGDAGIGKSRLVREFLDATGRSRGRVAVGRCRPFGTPPYGPLEELLATLAPVAARLIPEQTQEAQLRSIVDTFLTAAQKHAIVGIIEDLHWSDSSTLSVLALLAERLATSRMLIVATYRANEFGPQHPHFVAFGALQRDSSVAAIGLSPLGPQDVRAFIDATLSSVPGSVTLDQRRRVAQIAEGNPFFTEELLKDVLDRQLLHHHDRSLPATVHAAILERMHPLSTADRAILTQAAVIGRRFDAELLAHTLETDMASVLPALQRARHLQIVEETGEPMSFRFRHALTREAIYDELLSAQRRPLHRRIAAALEAQTAWSATPDAVAYHWWAAGDRAKALEHGLRGGDAAQALHAYADSIECYERTLSLLDPNGRDAALLQARIGKSYFRSGFNDRAIDHFHTAWVYYRSARDDAASLFDLARNLAAAMYNHGQRLESTSFLREAVDTIAACGDRRVTAYARVTFASYLVETGDITETQAVLDDIEPELVDGDIDPIYWLTACRIHELEGDAAGVRAAAERVFAIEGADATATINGLTEVSMSAIIIGETSVARQCVGRALELCVATQLKRIEGSLLVTSAYERVLSGAFEEARTQVLRALPLIGEVEVSRHGMVVAALAAGLAIGDRRLLAHEPDAAFIERSLETGLPIKFGPLAASCVQLLAARGELDAARRLLQRAVRTATDALPFTGSFPLVVVAAEHCDRAQAEDIRKLCAATAASGPASKAAAELGRAILLRRFGSPDSAVAPAQAAAAGFTAVGWPLYEALALEVSGDRVGAERIRERLGLRDRPVQQPRPRNDDVETLLTPRELEVARLVASGSTNRKVADTLNVSVKLVEKSLSSIYEKLAVTSRSQLTARIIARDIEDRRTAG